MKRTYRPASPENVGTKKPRGAQHSQDTTVRLLQSWLFHHKTAFRDSLLRLLAFPLQSLLTWMVIAIALALPATLYLGLQNVQQLGQGWQDSTQMSAFVVKGAQQRAI